MIDPKDFYCHPMAGEKMREWQSIETAPKDGTRFIAFQNPFGIYISYRHDPGGESKNPKHHYECWVTDGNSTKGYPCKPTHWMLLPDSPK